MVKLKNVKLKSGIRKVVLVAIPQEKNNNKIKQIIWKFIIYLANTWNGKYSFLTNQRQV